MMNKPDGGEAAGNITGWPELVSNQVAPIYRFHLFLTGDASQAVSRTQQTFQSVSREYRSGKIKRENLSLGLWRAARTRWYTRWQNADQAKEDWKIAESLADDAQEKDLILLRIRRASQSIERLSRLQAETLLMLFVAGMDVHFVSQVIQKSVSQVEALAVEGLFQLTLQEEESLSTPNNLSDPILQPTLEGLEDLAMGISIDAGIVDQVIQGSNRLSQPAPRARLLQDYSGRLITSAALLGIIIYAIINFFVLPQTPLSSNQTPTATSYPTTNIGFLITPDESICQSWQDTLSTTFQLKFQRNMDARFADPSRIEPDLNGSGCELTARASAAVLVPQEVLSQADSLIRAGGYHFDREFVSSGTCPNCYQFPGDWGGVGRLYSTETSRAILSIGWHPTDPSLCPTQSPTQTCPLTSSQRVVTVRLDFAINPVQIRLQQFMDRWSQGLPEALLYLAPGLRERVSTMVGLDALGGMPVGIWNNTTIRWSTRMMTTDSVLYFVQVRRIASGVEFGNLGIRLKKSTSGWLVNEIWSNRLQSTQDTVYGGDQQGHVVAVSLDSGAVVPLTDAGFYQPSETAGLIYPRNQARLSPNGAWLALSMPQNASAPGGETGTWLVSTGGAGSVKLNDLPLHLVWSPDSSHIAYVNPRDPGGILTEITPRGGMIPLVHLPGYIRGMAWSPDGNWMAILYQKVDESGQPVQLPGLGLALVRTPEGSVEQLITLPYANPGSVQNPDQELSWTEDSRQVWYGPGLVAVEVGSGKVLPLVSKPSEYSLTQQQLFSLQISAWENSSNPITAASTDMKFIASAYVEPYPGRAYQITIQHFSDMVEPEINVENQRVAALSWTQDASALVVASSVEVPGTVSLVNPHTGEVKQLHPAISFIGLRSQLQRDSRHLAPQVVIKRARGVALNPASWPGYTSKTFQLSFHYPSEYQVFQNNNGNGDIIISSLNFSSPLGFTDLDSNSIYVMINRYAEYLAPGGSVYQNSEVWEPVQVGALTGYRRRQQDVIAGPVIIEVPLRNGLLRIAKYPATSTLDPVFEKILSTLAVEQP